MHCVSTPAVPGAAGAGTRRPARPPRRPGYRPDGQHCPPPNRTGRRQGARGATGLPPAPPRGPGPASLAPGPTRCTLAPRTAAPSAAAAAAAAASCGRPCGGSGRAAGGPAAAVDPVLAEIGTRPAAPLATLTLDSVTRLGLSATGCLSCPLDSACLSCPLDPACLFCPLTRPPLLSTRRAHTIVTRGRARPSVEATVGAGPEPYYGSPRRGRAATPRPALTRD